MPSKKTVNKKWNLAKIVLFIICLLSFLFSTSVFAYVVEIFNAINEIESGHMLQKALGQIR